MANDIGICKEVLLLRHSDRMLLFIWWDELRFPWEWYVFEDGIYLSFRSEAMKSFCVV